VIRARRATAVRKGSSCHLPLALAWRARKPTAAASAHGADRSSWAATAITENASDKRRCTAPCALQTAHRPRPPWRGDRARCSAQGADGAGSMRRHLSQSLTPRRAPSCAHLLRAVLSLASREFTLRQCRIAPSREAGGRSFLTAVALRALITGSASARRGGFDRQSHRPETQLALAGVSVSVTGPPRECDTAATGVPRKQPHPGTYRPVGRAATTPLPLSYSVSPARRWTRDHPAIADRDDGDRARTRDRAPAAPRSAACRSRSSATSTLPRRRTFPEVLNFPVFHPAMTSLNLTVTGARRATQRSRRPNAGFLPCAIQDHRNDADDRAVRRSDGSGGHQCPTPGREHRSERRRRGHERQRRPVRSHAESATISRHTSHGTTASAQLVRQPGRSWTRARSPARTARDHEHHRRRPLLRTVPPRRSNPAGIGRSVGTTGTTARMRSPDDRQQLRSRAPRPVPIAASSACSAAAAMSFRIRLFRGAVVAMAIRASARRAWRPTPTSPRPRRYQYGSSKRRRGAEAASHRSGRRQRHGQLGRARRGVRPPPARRSANHSTRANPAGALCWNAALRPAASIG